MNLVLTRVPDKRFAVTLGPTALSLSRGSQVQMEVNEETEVRNSGPDLRICPQTWGLQVSHMLRARGTTSALGGRTQGCGEICLERWGMGRADCFYNDFSVLLGTSMFSPLNFSEAPTNQERSLP